MGVLSGFAELPRFFGRKVCGFLANKAFNESYEVIFANTQALREECFKLRYQIFCVERGFDLKSQNGMEIDGYDDRSAHFLLKHRPSNTYIATGRLILPDQGNLRTSLPLQQKLEANILKEHDLHNPDSVSKTCEISRIGILKSHSRQTSKVYRSGGGWATTIMRKKIADIGKLGLYRAVFALALNESDTPNCIFATDPFLLKRFSSVGFKTYNVIDDKLDIYGPVVAIKFNIHEMLENAKKQTPEGWMITTDNGRILGVARTKPSKQDSTHYRPKWVSNMFFANATSERPAYEAVKVKV